MIFKVFILFSILVSQEAFAQDVDVCRVALQSNAFNTFDQQVSNRIAFEEKEEVCSRDYESSEEFRSAARSGGFSLSYAGFGVGASGGKSSQNGRVHFREEAFCQASQDEFRQEYSSNTSITVADAALRAWTDCLDTTRRNSLWLEYELSDDGSGMTGTIYRTISSGPTTLRITSMQVQPSTLADQVDCSIENQIWTVSDFKQGKEVVTDTTKEIVACTKPADETVRVAFGTDGDSLTWVRMPSVQSGVNDKADEVRSQLLSLSADMKADIAELQIDLQEARDEARQMDQLTVSTQLQAQATCTAIGAGSSSFIAAVPRECSSDASSCTEICTSLASRTNDGQINAAPNHRVIGALHIYKNEPAGDLGRVGLKTYTYSAPNFDRRYCGPNFCCCAAN